MIDSILIFCLVLSSIQNYDVLTLIKYMHSNAHKHWNNNHLVVEQWYCCNSVWKKYVEFQVSEESKNVKYFAKFFSILQNFANL